MSVSISFGQLQLNSIQVENEHEHDRLSGFYGSESNNETFTGPTFQYNELTSYGSETQAYGIGNSHGEFANTVSGGYIVNNSYDWSDSTIPRPGGISFDRYSGDAYSQTTSTFIFGNPAGSGDIDLLTGSFTLAPTVLGTTNFQAQTGFGDTRVRHDFEIWVGSGGPGVVPQATGSRTMDASGRMYAHVEGVNDPSTFFDNQIYNNSAREWRSSETEPTPDSFFALGDNELEQFVRVFPEVTLDVNMGMVRDNEQLFIQYIERTSIEINISNDIPNWQLIEVDEFGEWITDTGYMDFLHPWTDGYAIAFAQAGDPFDLSGDNAGGSFLDPFAPNFFDTPAGATPGSFSVPEPQAAIILSVLLSISWCRRLRNAV